MALCDIEHFKQLNRICNTVDFFWGIKNLYSRFKINGIVAVLRFFLFMSILAKQQIFSRNVSNVKQLIRSMGDMDRTSVFFLFTSTTSTFTNKYDRLWPRKIYCILMGKCRQMPMFTPPKVATRHYSILNLCVSGWRFPCEFEHFNNSAKI